MEVSKMSKSLESNIAISFNNIHSIITRGLKVSIENVKGVIVHGFQDDERREGILNYIRALSSVLNAHHLTEDEIAFPYFRALLPIAPFDALMGEHQEMVVILGEINRAVDINETNDQFQNNLNILEDKLTRLNQIWRPHIQIESDQFISKADALIPVEEQLKLVASFSQHGVQIAVPHYLTVPFLLYNLSPKDRVIFSKDMPVEVVQHLVPVVWKSQWESMVPYLLD
jgi:Hemerythrin HHE cation binding domain